MPPRKRQVPQKTVDQPASSKRRKQPQKSSKGSHGTQITIPNRLKDAITKAQGYFELDFPLASLNGLDRLAWGVDSRAEFVVVCVKFSPKNETNANYGHFCVHSSTDGEDRGARHSHHFCSTKKEGKHAVTTTCTPRATILTIVLQRELFRLLGDRGCRKLDVVYDKISDIIHSDPTKQCLICQKAFNTKIYTPTACLGACMTALEQWPLRARFSHLLSDVKSLDFLLCSIYTAVDDQNVNPLAYKTEDSLLAGCPLELNAIQPAVDEFPQISDKLSMSDLLRGGKHKIERRQLLSWLPLRFRGCMVALGAGAAHRLEGADMDRCHQFMVLNARPERQLAFAENMAAKGTSVGTVAFHGCKAPRTFNILADALRDPSKLPYFCSDNGVFFSDSPGYSYCYALGGSPFRPWKRSWFLGQWAVVFGIEVADPHVRFRNKESSTMDESLLMIRYVFLIPRDDNDDLALHVYSAAEPFKYPDIDHEGMKRAYRTLNEGTLSPEHVGLKASKGAAQE